MSQPSAVDARHWRRRSASTGSTHRWSRLPMESRGQVAAVEYRIFRTDLDGVMHRENVLVPPDTARAEVAQALLRARRRLRASVRDANADIRAQPSLPFPALARSHHRPPAHDAQDAPMSLVRGTFRRLAAWWSGEDVPETAR